MNLFEELVSTVARAVPRGGGRIVNGLRGLYPHDTWRTTRVGDLSIRLNLSQALERIMYFGCYEHRMIRFAHRLLRPGDTALNAGAFIGWWSLHMAGAVGRRGQVHSFEPVPEHYNRMAETFRRARTSGYRLHANQLALGSEPGTLTMSVGNKVNPGFSTVINEFSRDGLRDRYQKVEVARLDEYMEERKIDRVRLLKVDTEGAEGMVLRGAERALRERRVQYVIAEISPQADEVAGRKRGDTFDYLRSLGYRGSILDRGRLRPVPNSFNFWVADTFWEAAAA